jgi:hypothetical protein
MLNALLLAQPTSKAFVAIGIDPLPLLQGEIEILESNMLILVRFRALPPIGTREWEVLPNRITCMPQRLLQGTLNEHCRTRTPLCDLGTTNLLNLLFLRHPQGPQLIEQPSRSKESLALPHGYLPHRLTSFLSRSSRHHLYLLYSILWYLSSLYLQSSGREKKSTANETTTQDATEPKHNPICNEDVQQPLETFFRPILSPHQEKKRMSVADLSIWATYF